MNTSTPGFARVAIVKSTRSDARHQRLAEAVSEYQQAVKLRPDFSMAHLELGLVLAAQGDRQSAAEHLRKAAAGKDLNVARQAAQTLQRISNP